MSDSAHTRRQFLLTGAAAFASARLAPTEVAALTLQQSVGRASARPSRAEDGDLTALTLKEAADRIRAKSVTPVGLVEACLRRIEMYNPKLNAFVTVMHEQAMAQAR